MYLVMVHMGMGLQLPVRGRGVGQDVIHGPGRRVPGGSSGQDVTLVPDANCPVVMCASKTSPEIHLLS